MCKWIALVAVVSMAIAPFASLSQPLWTQHTVVENYDWAWDSYPADIDQDGDWDFVCTGRYQDEIAWWENDGRGNFTHHMISNSYDGALELHVIDFDADGSIDILSTAFDADDITLWLNDGYNTFTEVIIADNYDGATGIYAADIDSDGDYDILSCSSISHQVSWWEYDGNSYIEHLIQSGFHTASYVHAADMDNDGDCDVLASSYGDYEGRKFAWWENDGLQNFTYHLLSDNIDGATFIQACDLDQDGDQDVLGAATWANQIMWWENTGMHNFTYHLIASGYLHARSNFPYDMDQDGDIDLLACASDADDISWWENNGSQQFTKRLVTNSVDYPVKPRAADIDGDGDYDILAAGGNADIIAWWEQHPAVEVFISPSYLPPPVYIPYVGGPLWYTVVLTNRTNAIIQGEFLTEAVLPSQYVYGPLLSFYLALGGGQSIYSPVLQLDVPGFAPTGQYKYRAVFSPFSTYEPSIDYFEFEKLAAPVADEIVHAWRHTDWYGENATAVSSAEQAKEYLLADIYPNPFNAFTEVLVNLPTENELYVTVYNIAGQQVAELASGLHQEGSHRFVFDATGLASGLYFVRASVPGEFDQTRKVMLVR